MGPDFSNLAASDLDQVGGEFAHVCTFLRFSRMILIQLTLKFWKSRILAEVIFFLGGKRRMISIVLVVV